MYRLLLSILTMIILNFSCTEKDEPTLESAAGILKEMEASTFIYGTHVLESDSGTINYALKSTTINLDLYINEKVKVKGNLVDGYPMGGGPKYMDVKYIQKISK